LDIAKASYVTDSTSTVKCMEDCGKRREGVSTRLDNYLGSQPEHYPPTDFS